uniref:TRAF-type domain-containing protein n=1 Tax=Macrostomum lignano TaxID=282301 RepID=A0A1I8IXW3_9PLAT
VAPRCPLDQVAIDKEKVYVDKAFQKETDNLGVKCSFSARGCPWTGLLLELMAHMEGCDRMMTTCPMRCGVEFEKRFLEKHRNDDCPKREIHCQFCEIRLIAENEAEHLEICPKFLVPCPNKCKRREVARERLTEHLENECMKQDLNCPFASYGCQFTGKKKAMKEHVAAKQLNHMEILCAAVQAGRQKSRRIKTKPYKRWRRRCWASSAGSTGWRTCTDRSSIWKIDNYEEKLAERQERQEVHPSSAAVPHQPHGYTSSPCPPVSMAMARAVASTCRLFVCICKGDNDPLLAWPFRAYKITFHLIDQCEDVAARRNIVYPNTCKENRPFLAVRLARETPVSGRLDSPNWKVIGTLDYIKDDTMYIKVEVDCEDMEPL